MGFMQRFERKLEDAVGNTFARVFGGKIVPAEVEDALHREAAHGLQNLNGHALAPNHYVLTVSETDEASLTSDTELTLHGFAKHLTGYIGEQGWETYGEVSVALESSPDLHTGQFRARSVISPDDASSIGDASTNEQLLHVVGHRCAHQRRCRCGSNSRRRCPPWSSSRRATPTIPRP